MSENQYSFKWYFYTMVFLIQTSIVFIQYCAMASLVKMIIPTIFSIFSLMIAYLSLGNPIYSYHSFCNAIIYFPLFTLFISIILEIIEGFFSDLPSKIGISNIKSIVIKIFYQNNSINNSNKWRAFLIFSFVLMLMVFLALQYYFAEVGVSGALIILIGWYPVILGIYNVVVESWKSLIIHREEKEKDMALFDSKSDASDEQDAIEQNGLFMTLFDPLNIRKQEKWIKTLNDPQINIFRNFDGLTRYHLIGISIFFMILIRMVVDFCTIRVFDASLQGIFSLLCLPLCMIINFSVVFYNKETMEKKSNIRLILWVALGLYIFIIIIISLFGLFVLFFKPPNISSLLFTDTTNTSILKPDLTPGYCLPPFSYSPNLAQMAGLSTLPRLFKLDNKVWRLNNDSVKVINESMKYFYGKDTNISRFSFQSVHHFYPAILIDDHLTKTSILSLGGHDSHLGMALFFEMFLKSKIPVAIDKIVPFISVLDSIMPKPMMMLPVLGKYLAFSVPLHEIISLTIGNNIIKYKKQNYSLLFTGHSIGGYIAKDVALFLGVFYNTSFYVTSFEGINIPTSQNDLFTIFNAHDTNYLWDNVNNIYYDDSMFGGYDDFIRSNIRLPNFRGSLSPLSVYDSYCIAAARCSENDGFVPFCQQTLSEGSKDLDSILGLFSKRSY